MTYSIDLANILFLFQPVERIKNSLHSWKSQQCSFTVLLYSYETLQFSFQNGLACLGLPKNITLLNYFNNIRLTKQNEQEVSGLPEALMKKVFFRDERQT